MSKPSSLAHSVPPAPPDAWLGEILGRSEEYAVIAISLAGQITGWSGAAARLFGYAEHEIVGKPFATLFEASEIDKRLPQVELELARQAGRSEDDRWHVRQNGTRFWSSGVVNRHLDAQHQHIGYVKILRDRTDLRTRYEALQNRLRHVTQQVASEQEALTTLVHELRNPLAPIVNAARIVASEASADVKARMMSVIARQSEVIQRLLEEAGQDVMRHDERLQLRTIVLQDAVSTVVDALLPEARAKGLELDMVVPPKALAIEVDPARLQQMVLNLVSNAVKYTRGGGHVTVAATVEGEMAVIRVDDDGEGIAKENVERVFELFTREENNEAVPGHGIGLAVVKRLAWQHGGFVEARSPGKGLGSQFTLQLPLSQVGRG
ncbi:MAG TPA: PAS domain-containing sensor histidine kinase [Burkholderiaceae bacterium]|nr:PAS domain-containing sensor histidine kinase [Burkholderiaceae bacterium]